MSQNESDHPGAGKEAADPDCLELFEDDAAPPPDRGPDVRGDDGLDFVEDMFPGPGPAFGPAGSPVPRPGPARPVARPTIVDAVLRASPARDPGLRRGDDCRHLLGTDCCPFPRPGTGRPRRMTTTGRAAGPHGSGDYQVIHRIATGGTASVTLVRHRRLRKAWMALKRLVPQSGLTRPMLEQLVEREAGAAELEHYHIVRIFDVGADVEGPFVVMEYVAGPAGREAAGLAARCRRPGAAADTPGTRRGARAAASARGLPAGRQALRRGTLRAPARLGPPRPQAGQRPAHCRPRAETRRLRPGLPIG